MPEAAPQGRRLRVTCPLRIACQRSAAKDIWRSERDGASVGSMSSAVLVAEPEPETRAYLGRQLRDDGFEVIDAAVRSEVLELAERARPDLVLLAELELCLRLRRGEPGRTWDRNVPVSEDDLHPMTACAST